MKNLLLIWTFLCLNYASLAQSTVNEDFVEINFDVLNFVNKVKTFDEIKKTNFSAEFPLMSNEIETLVFTKNESLLEEKLQVKTFSAQSQKSSVHLNLTIKPDSSFSGLIKTHEGYFFLESASNQKVRYYSMQKLDLGNISCGAEALETIKEVKDMGAKFASANPFPIGNTLRRFRFAVATTGEFTQFYGGKQNALLKVVEVVNSINLIFRLEAAIELTLIEKTLNEDLIFDNSTTDPFTPDVSFANAARAQSGFNTLNSSGALPYSSYDLGHVFHVFSSSMSLVRGMAGGTPCVNNSKGLGWSEWSSSLNFANQIGFITLVSIHEIAHQFSAGHTFNAAGNSFCSTGWTFGSAIEPGSGSSLMAYGNNCSTPINYVLEGNHYLNYFHTKSLESIFNSLASTATCFTSSSTNNTPPVANAGNDIYIPKSTPFYLTGTASDENDSNLSYTWEQYDVATLADKGAFGATIFGEGGYSATQSTTAPLFRSFQSNTTTTRFFPRNEFLFNNKSNPNYGEALPEVARTMKFRFTVRDNNNLGGGVDSDEMTVHVVDAGPLAFKPSENFDLLYTNGSNLVDINWDVNNTNLAPLNVKDIKISLSTDGGTTFGTTLVASTPNNGNAKFTIPSLNSGNAKLKIEPVGDFNFYNVSQSNLKIINNCTSPANTLLNIESLTVSQDNSWLNLNLSPIGNPITSFRGSFTANDTPSNILPLKENGACKPYSNSRYHKVYNFRVLESTTVTFSNITNNVVGVLYSNSFSLANVCQNWISSSLTISPTFNQSSTLTQTLSPGEYSFVLFTFGNGAPTLPINFNINVSGNILGSHNYSETEYHYSYLVKDEVSNTIVSVQNNSDLSGFRAGKYQVYGLSHANFGKEDYVGGSFQNFQTVLANQEVCAKLSTNFKSVEIKDSDCQCMGTVQIEVAINKVEDN